MSLDILYAIALLFHQPSPWASKTAKPPRFPYAPGIRSWDRHCRGLCSGCRHVPDGGTCQMAEPVRSRLWLHPTRVSWLYLARSAVYEMRPRHCPDAWRHRLVFSRLVADQG